MNKPDMLTKHTAGTLEITRDAAKQMRFLQI